MRVLHRYWTGEPYLHAELTAAVLRDRHPDDDLIEWHDNMLPAWLIEWLDERAQLVCDVPAERARHRSNMVRWWLLYEHGGVWVDHDVVALASLTELRRPFTAALHHHRSCCVLGFDRHDPITRRALDAIDDLDPSERSSIAVSGASLLNELCDRTVGVVELPFDRNGARTSVAQPLVVHLWATRGDHRSLLAR